MTTRKPLVLIGGDLQEIPTGDTIPDAAIADNAVTNAKLADMATLTIKARKAGTTGDPEDCSLSELLDFIGSAAQGDILYRGASGWARLAAGTSGQYLKTQGPGANPVWDTPGGGGSGDYVKIAEVVTASSQAAVTFDNIPQTYRDLEVIVRARGTQAAAAVQTVIRFNNDSSGIYRYSRENRYGSTQSVTATAGQIGSICGTSVANVDGLIRVLVGNYANDVRYKVARAISVATDGTTTANQLTENCQVIWPSAAAITRIDLVLSAGNFLDDSVISLFGLN